MLAGISFAAKIPEPKINFDPSYNTLLINLDEQQLLKIILKNDLNESDIFHLNFGGNFIDILDVQIQPLPNLTCSSSNCDVQIGPKSEFTLYLTCLLYTSPSPRD